MSVLPKCSECKRKSGYTSDLQSGQCERCLVGAGSGKDSDNSDDDDE